MLSVPCLLVSMMLPMLVSGLRFASEIDSHLTAADPAECPESGKRE